MEDDLGQIHTISHGFPSANTVLFMKWRKTPSRSWVTFSLCFHLTERPDLKPLEVFLWRIPAIRADEARHSCGIVQGPGTLCAIVWAAQIVKNNAKVWRGFLLPTGRQGIKFFGTPLGHPDFVARHLQAVVAEHQTMLDRIHE